MVRSSCARRTSSVSSSFALGYRRRRRCSVVDDARCSPVVVPPPFALLKTIASSVHVAVFRHRGSQYEVCAQVKRERRPVGMEEQQWQWTVVAGSRWLQKRRRGCDDSRSLGYAEEPARCDRVTELNQNVTGCCWLQRETGILILCIGNAASLPPAFFLVRLFLHPRTQPNNPFGVRLVRSRDCQSSIRLDLSLFLLFF